MNFKAPIPCCSYDRPDVRLEPATLRCRLEPDVGATVAARVADLVGQAGAARLLTEIHEEVGVQGQTALLCIDVNLKHGRALPAC